MQFIKDQFHHGIMLPYKLCTPLSISLVFFLILSSILPVPLTLTMAGLDDPRWRHWMTWMHPCLHVQSDGVTGLRLLTWKPGNPRDSVARGICQAFCDLAPEFLEHHFHYMLLVKQITKACSRGGKLESSSQWKKHQRICLVFALNLFSSVSSSLFLFSSVGLLNKLVITLSSSPTLWIWLVAAISLASFNTFLWPLYFLKMRSRCRGLVRFIFFFMLCTHTHTHTYTYYKIYATMCIVFQNNNANILNNNYYNFFLFFPLFCPQNISH